MPLDGVTARFLSKELSTSLVGARVDKIHQPQRSDLILALRTDQGSQRLFLSANPAAPCLYLTSASIKNPVSPPRFCMLLRKHLLGARITKISCPDWERIFIFEFLTSNEMGDQEEKTLIAEIMGRHSNIILLNQAGYILDAIHHVDNSISRVREVMPARLYQLPPAQAKTDIFQFIEQGMILPAQLDGRGLAQALLATLKGFSPQLCQELVLRAGLAENTRLADLTAGQKASLERAIMTLAARIKTADYQPSTFYLQEHAEVPLDFHALPLAIYAISRPEQDISAAMELFYRARDQQNTLQQKRQALEKKVASRLLQVEKKLVIHQEDSQSQPQALAEKRSADLLLANLSLYQPGAAFIEAIDYFSPDQATIRLELAAGKTATQTAQLHFRRYEKLMLRAAAGQRLAEADRAEIGWLESLLHEIDMAQSDADFAAIRQQLAAGGLDRQKAAAGPDQVQIQQPGRPGKGKYKKPARKKQPGKKDAGLPPYRFVSSDGFTILAGRNNLQNDSLTLRQAARDDIWLHAKDNPGSHVIIRSEKKTVPTSTLQEAAALAAWFSRPAAQARKSGAVAPAKIAIDYCFAAQVKKPAGARPGMVIYDKYKTILASPALLKEA